MFIWSLLQPAFAQAAVPQPDPAVEKAKLIDSLIARNERFAERPADEEFAAPYEDRLRTLLSKASSSVLDKLDAHGVTVCLDQRLSRDALDDQVVSIFYKYGNSMTLSLYDNGDDPGIQIGLPSYLVAADMLKDASKSMNAKDGYYAGVVEEEWMVFKGQGARETRVTLADQPDLRWPPLKDSVMAGLRLTLPKI